MKKGIKILVTLVILISVIIGGAMIALTQGLEEGKNLDVNGVDFSNVEDGIYKGTYDFKRWSNELDVTVKDHKITNIEIVKDVRFANPAVSVEVFDDVIKAQDTTVDIVSGSTVTTKAYLKAIENAFKK